MEFTNNHDLKIFADDLIVELIKNNENGFVLELQKWGNTAFSSSSEFLGEFMLILERIKSSEKLSKSTKIQVTRCINVIKNVFQ